MFNLLKNKLTKDKKEVALFWATIDVDKYNKCEKNNSLIRIHPLYSDDKFIKNQLAELVDYIRDNYEVNEL